MARKALQELFENTGMMIPCGGRCTPGREEETKKKPKAPKRQETERGHLPWKSKRPNAQVSMQSENSTHSFRVGAPGVGIRPGGGFDSGAGPPECFGGLGGAGGGGGSGSFRRKKAALSTSTVFSSGGRWPRWMCWCCHRPCGNGKFHQT